MCKKWRCQYVHPFEKTGSKVCSALTHLLTNSRLRGTFFPPKYKAGQKHFRGGEAAGASELIKQTLYKRVFQENVKYIHFGHVQS